MAAFFIPGFTSADDSGAVEVAYGVMRKRVQVDMGRLPRERRIEKLFARRGSIDCTTAVGLPDPLLGGTVMAIFDMGPRQPFIVWREADLASDDGSCEVLGWSAYSVLEFDS
jgi:hypothetical protein